MQGSRPRDRLHSTPEADPRPKLWLRVIGSLALFGFLVGMMIGRVVYPDPDMASGTASGTALPAVATLERVESTPDVLSLWFDAQPSVRMTRIDGSLSFTLTAAQGPEQNGHFSLEDKDVRWRVEKARTGLVVNLVTARPLQADWSTAAEEGRWRLKISLRSE